MLLVHIGIASCAPINSINECVSPKTFSTIFFMFQCNEHVEMNTFLCSLTCTWMLIIDSQF